MNFSQIWLCSQTTRGHSPARQCWLCRSVSWSIGDRAGREMGLIFSWLWDQREVAPPLLGVTTETQVSANPPSNPPGPAECVFFFCGRRQQWVWLLPWLNILYQPAPSVLLQASTPPPFSPSPLFSLVNSLSLITPPFPPTSCSSPSPSLLRLSLLLSSPLVLWRPIGSPQHVHLFMHVSPFLSQEEKVEYGVWGRGGCICL